MEKLIIFNPIYLSIIIIFLLSLQVSYLDLKNVLIASTSFCFASTFTKPVLMNQIVISFFCQPKACRVCPPLTEVYES